MVIGGSSWVTSGEESPYVRLRGAHLALFSSIMHEIDKYMLLGMFLMHGRRFKILGDLLWILQLF